MGKAIINIGTNPNDGLGEAIRTGFEKINAMFAELYPRTDLKLALTFDDIANVPVANATNLAQWNVFFNLPELGVPFKSVSVLGNVVTLTGAFKIILKDSLFRDNMHIVDVTDDGCVYYISDFSFCDSTLVSCDFPFAKYAGYSAFRLYNGNQSYLVSPTLSALTTAGGYCFSGCTGLVSPTFPALTTAGEYCFYNCTELVSPTFPALTTAGGYCFSGCAGYINIVLPAIASLGTNVLDNAVFNEIAGNVEVLLTIPTALMTCNEGNPDGDIQYLMNNNTLVTITQV